MGIVISDIPLPKLTSPKASVLCKPQKYKLQKINKQIDEQESVDDNDDEG